jgi:hypothetical protein
MGLFWYTTLYILYMNWHLGRMYQIKQKTNSVALSPRANYTD